MTAEIWVIFMLLLNRCSVQFPRMSTQLSTVVLVSVYSKNSRFYENLPTSILYLLLQQLEVTDQVWVHQRIWCTHIVRQHQNQAFGQQWTGCGSPVNWPAKSSYFNPLDIWLYTEWNDMTVNGESTGIRYYLGICSYEMKKTMETFSQNRQSLTRLDLSTSACT